MSPSSTLTVGELYPGTKFLLTRLVQIPGRIILTTICNECGIKYRGERRDVSRRMQSHAVYGHGKCGYCNASVPNRQNGTPRQHAYRSCPTKDEGFAIVKEFKKNISKQGYR